MLFSMKTDKGIVREQNQDGYFVTAIDENTFFAVVCDGMGGPNAGDVASKLAVSNISERFISAWRQGISLSSVKNILITALNAANIVIFDEAAENPEYEGMGTTAVAAYVSGNDAIIANIGDSRAYIIDNGIKQITKDNSLVQEMIDSGKLAQEDLKFFPYKNVITRALGIEEHIEIDFFETKISDGNRLLLCSDGLTNYVSDSDIFNISNESDAENVAGHLIESANKNGGGDNITVVVLTK